MPSRGSYLSGSWRAYDRGGLLPSGLGPFRCPVGGMQDAGLDGPSRVWSRWMALRVSSVFTGIQHYLHGFWVTDPGLLLRCNQRSLRLETAKTGGVCPHGRPTIQALLALYNAGLFTSKEASCPGASTHTSGPDSNGAVLLYYDNPGRWSSGFLQFLLCITFHVRTVKWRW